MWDLVGFAGFCAIGIDELKDAVRIGNRVIDVVFGVVERVFE